MPVGTARPRVLSCSTCIVEAVMGPLQRGLVHSAFKSAANIVFPGDFVLSLNAATSPRMPNGIQLATESGTMPFAHLRVGMPVLLGVQRLCIQSLDYVLDLSHASQWHPFIERPANVDMRVVQKNCHWLAESMAMDRDMTMNKGRERDEGMAITTIRWGGATVQAADQTILEIAHMLCGRGRGLTPTGDDMLAGWMAIGWLLKGPEPDFLAACQQIVAIARRQTHLLSQCWLNYAANGYVAEPIGALLLALTQEDEKQLAQATQAVLAMGATSGYDVIQGITLSSFI